VAVTLSGARNASGSTVVQRAAFAVVSSPDGFLESLEGRTALTATDGRKLDVSASVRRFLFWEFGSLAVTDTSTGKTVNAGLVFAPVIPVTSTPSGPSVTVEATAFSIYRWALVSTTVKLEIGPG